MRLSAIVGGVALLIAVGVPATASAASGSGAAWQPYRTAPWTDAPGAECTLINATAEDLCQTLA